MEMAVLRHCRQLYMVGKSVEVAVCVMGGCLMGGDGMRG